MKRVLKNDYPLFPLKLHMTTAGDMAEVVEHLPSKPKALDSIFSKGKKKITYKNLLLL
jgi:hypothetical protein